MILDPKKKSHRLGKIVFVYVMTAYGERRCSSYHSLLRQQMEVSGQLHVPATLPPGPAEWEAGLAPEPVRTFWRQEKLFSLLRTAPWFLGRPAHSLVPVPAELPLFPYKLSNARFKIYPGILSSTHTADGIMSSQKTWRWDAVSSDSRISVIQTLWDLHVPVA